MADINAEWFHRVLRMASELHEGQFDKVGVRYIEHPKRVAKILCNRWPDATQPEIEAALLHDTIEDCGISFHSLIDAGVTPEAAQIVLNVTRPPGLEGTAKYLAWIQEIASGGDVSTIRVKLSDLGDNMDLSRPDFAGRAERIKSRYEPAKHMLEAALIAAEMVSAA